MNYGRASSLATQPQPAQPAAPSAFAADNHIVVRIELTAPLLGHHGAIGVLELKEPTFGDYLDCGPLVRNIAMDPQGEGKMKVEVVDDTEALAQWAQRLTGQPQAILRTLRPRDAFALRREISRIVAEFELGNLPSAPTSSSSSSA